MIVDDSAHEHVQLDHILSTRELCMGMCDCLSDFCMHLFAVVACRNPRDENANAVTTWELADQRMTRSKTMPIGYTMTVERGYDADDEEKGGTYSSRKDSKRGMKI